MSALFGSSFAFSGDIALPSRFVRIDWHPQDPAARNGVSRGRSMPRIAGTLPHPSLDGLLNDSQRSDVQSGNEMLRPRWRRAARTPASDRRSSVGRRPSRPSAAVNIAASSSPVARVPAMLTDLPMNCLNCPPASSRLRTVADLSSSDRAGVSSISKSPIRSSSVAISTSTISETGLTRTQAHYGYLRWVSAPDSALPQNFSAVGYRWFAVKTSTPTGMPSH
jgi:hypothetical protein